jgi:hypothetical protein
MKNLTLTIVALLSIIVSASAQQPNKSCATGTLSGKPSFYRSSRGELYVCSDGYRWQKLGTTVLGVNEIVPSPAVKISPNPLVSTGVITLNVPTAGVVEISLTTITGSTVQTISNGKYPEGEHSWNIATDKLSSGVYVCMVKMGGTTTRSLITIQK